LCSSGICDAKLRGAGGGKRKGGKKRKSANFEATSGPTEGRRLAYALCRWSNNHVMDVGAGGEGGKKGKEREGEGGAGQNSNTRSGRSCVMSAQRRIGFPIQDAVVVRKKEGKEGRRTVDTIRPFPISSGIVGRGGGERKEGRTTASFSKEEAGADRIPDTIPHFYNYTIQLMEGKGRRGGNRGN